MMSENEVGNTEAASLARYPTAERIGFARLTTMAFGGADLRPLRDQLLSKVAEGTAGAGEGLDLSLITQLLGNKQVGVAIQAEVLAFHQLYRSPCAAEQPKLRVLALAAAIDMGGNTPIEFLLEGSGIELQTLYVVDGVELPMPLPEHDVAIVIASDSEECRDALRKIERAASRMPRSSCERSSERPCRSSARRSTSERSADISSCDIWPCVSAWRTLLATLRMRSACAFSSFERRSDSRVSESILPEAFCCCVPPSRLSAWRSCSAARRAASALCGPLAAPCFIASSACLSRLSACVTRGSGLPCCCCEFEADC